MMNENDRKGNYKLIGGLILALSFALFFTNKNYAEDTQDNPIGFSLETIMPNNQIDQNKNYFYIKTNPNEGQELKVKLTGTSEDPIKVKAYVANAVTADSGTVDYLPEKDKDETLTNSIEEITTISETEFELKKGEEKIVQLNIAPPDEHYDGVKMGAIYFERVLDKVEKGKINNKYSYRVGLMTSETDKLYTDSQNFKLLEVTPEIKRTQKSITLTLQNPDPKTIADLQMDVKIVDEKSGKVVKTQKLTNGMVAPNSRFNYSVNWGVDPIKSGKYIAKVSATSRAKSWELEKKFEVTYDQAKKMNEETLYKLTLPTWSYVVTAILGVATVGLTISLGIRRSKWTKRIKKESKKGSKKRKAKKG